MKCDDFEALHIEMHVHTSNLNIVRDCFEGDKENWLLITFEFTEGEGGGVHCGPFHTIKQKILYIF